MSRHRGAVAETPLVASLTHSLDHLQAAHGFGQDRLPPSELERLHGMLDRAGSRRSLSADHTVVGVFGPTGSGKSSLVNALSGTDAARVAARRPTTSEPLALVWGRAGSDELLDWLRVGQRVELPAGTPLVGGAAVWDALTLQDTGTQDAQSRRDGRDRRGARLRGLFRWGRRSRSSAVPEAVVVTQSKPQAPADTAGLILLDLPDFDSTALAHREIVQRLSGQVDVLLWVVDPQKYADAALHQGFLHGLASHEAVMLVALNQADRLDAEDLQSVRSSLTGILAAEGLPGVEVFPVSARTGEGVEDLARAIRSLAGGRAAASRRLTADAVQAATHLLPFSTEEPIPAPSDAARTALAGELGRAAGVPVVVDAVRSSYRRDAHAAMGWPVTRWLAGLRPDPLRRLNLRREDVAPEHRRSSLSSGEPAQRARVDHGLRVFGDAAAAGAVEPWHSSIRDAARGTASTLTDALDTAVTGTDLETGRRAWWVIIGVLQWIAFAALVVGLVWLAVLAGLGFLQLPAIEVPRVEGFPLPTLLIIGGAGAGILLGILAALLARWGAARRAARVRRRLLAACSRVAEAVVMQPVEDEQGRCNAFRSAVLAALGRR